MKQSGSFLPTAVVLLIATILFSFSKSTNEDPAMEIASPEYGKISEQYLQHLANFEWEASYALLADDVVFKMPDGDTDTRTTIKGIKAVKQFWDNYVQKSGNNKLVLKDFVHVPVKVNQIIDHVGVTGVFDMCYFSASLSYAGGTANVRMHWAFHFNDEKKIDGIYSYYDRTPIIETAKKNFLTQQHSDKASEEEMVVQIIKIKSDLPEAELLKTARERAPQFKAIPGLLQKYYLRLGEPGCYSGVYVWDSKASLQAFKNSDLAATIGKAYKVVEAPRVEVSDVLFQLRD